MEATRWALDTRTALTHSSIPGRSAPVIPLRPEAPVDDWSWLQARPAYPRVEQARQASRRPHLRDFSPLESVQWLMEESARGRMDGYQPTPLDDLMAAALPQNRDEPSALGECSPVLVVLQWWQQRHRAHAFEKAHKVLELARAADPRDNEVAAQLLEAAAWCAGSPELRFQAVELLRAIAAWAGEDGGRFLDSALAAERAAAARD